MDMPGKGFLSKIFGSDADEPNDTKTLINHVRNKIQESRSSGSRISHEGIWMTNIAYCLGFDSVYYDTTTRQFKVVGRANQYLKRNRIHINKVLPTLQNRLARLSKSRPKYQVKPNTNDQEDKDAARLSEQILDMLWHKEEMSQKILELFMWVQQCGHAYLKVNWDPALGEPMVNPMTGEQDYEGDIRVDVVSPFEVFPDPLAKTMRDCQWVAQAKIRKLDYFKSQYGEKGEQVKEEGAWLLSLQYEGRINSLNVQGPSSGTNVHMKNSAIEMVYYEKRSKQHPNGRMIIAAGDVLLEDKELPAGEIPLVKFDDIIVAGKFYSESVVTHLRPVQDQYNNLVSRRSEWVNKLLAGKYLAAKGHSMTSETLNDRSGEIVEYTPVPNAMPPTAMDIPQIPAYAYKEEDALEGMFNEISGLNEVSRGQAPGSGITAAIALQYLSEQDDTRIGIMSRRHELNMARVGRLLLLYVEKFYQMPRVLKIAGQNMEYTVKNFVGADMRGNTDVAVIEGSTLPGSITAKRDFILTIFNQGLLGKPDDPAVREKILKQLEFGDVAETWQDYGLDMAQIQRDLDMIEEGGLPDISEFDNHAMHVQEKNRYRKSEKFLNLTPDKQLILMENIEGHINAQMHLDNPGMAVEEMMGPPPVAPVLPDEAALLAQAQGSEQQLTGVEGI